ncbi:MAG TPA: sodium-dependent transporter [Syntrophomonadaceae bacterium]|nr:sodium-dependent transporter [Syntrophomonadaceae bacterium]
MESTASTEKRETFTSRFGGFMVIIMTSLGLGNIWRFPYLAAKYGGAAFVLVYLLAIVFIVNIGNMCEICMGKFSRRAVVGAFTAIGRRPVWRICGIAILCLNIIVLSYYNVVIGWVARYFFTSFSGAVWRAPSPEVFFKAFIDTPQVFLWVLLVNAIVFGILWFGVTRGLEKASLIMGPVLFIIMSIMVVRTLNLHGVSKGLEYYLAPNWNYLFRYETWMQAIGQALWSGAFGWGIILTMGSYMKKGEDIGSSITQTGLLDGAISWLVGLAIIPACIVYGVPLDSGTSLSFLVLPKMFQEMPGGHLMMILFYASLALAGIGATVGCVEAGLAPMMEEWGWSRKMAIPVGFVLWNVAALPASLNKNVFDWLDTTIGSYAILLGGFFILFFVGWAWGADRVRKYVLNLGADIPFGPWWNVLVKYVAPGLIAFAAYGFFKVWLLPSVPGPVAWPLIIVICAWVLFMFVEAVRHPVPPDIGDIPKEVLHYKESALDRLMPASADDKML